MDTENELTVSATGPRQGRIVDIHAHFLPACYRDALARAGAETLDGGMPIPDWSLPGMLAVMDRYGVGKAIISVSSPGLNVVPAAEEAALARAINEAAAEIVIQHPTRFGGFATLPVSDEAACLAEIDYALDVLKLDGFILETNHRGTYPGATRMAPILAALHARHAVVLLHPTSPTCMHCIGGGLPGPAIEFPFDTTRAVVDLIYTGALAKFGNIRFILPHAGGTLPFLQMRIAGFAAVPGPWATAGLTPPQIIAALRGLYYDTALSANPGQMAALRGIAPVEHILFGSDLPFAPEQLLGAGIAALETMDIFDAAEREAVLHGNADRLLARGEPE